MSEQVKQKKSKFGRPVIIKTPEEFLERSEKYFNEQIEKDEPILLTGLCNALGFCSKNTLYDYAKKPDFSESVSWARQVIESQYEKGLWNKDIQGANMRFVLNSFGWVETKNLDHTSGGEPMSNKLDVKVVFVDNKDDE